MSRLKIAKLAAFNLVYGYLIVRSVHHHALCGFLLMLWFPAFAVACLRLARTP